MLTENPGGIFRVYGAKVTEQEIIWYVDKKEVGRSENNYWKQRPMQVALSLGLRKLYTEFKCNGFIPINPIEDFTPEKINQSPPNMIVDYIRVWAKKE